MGHRLRQNDTNISDIYIGRPISISDVQYLYRTSNIYIQHPGTYIRHPGTYIQHPGTYTRHPGTYIRHPGTYIRHPGTYIRRPISISDIRYLYPTSDIQYPTSARAGLGLGQGYRTSDIDIGRRIYILDVLYIYIGRPIYILDVRYRFRKHWWHFVLTVPHMI